MEKDKTKHYLVSWIGATVFSLLLLTVFDFTMSALIGSSAMLLIGVGYEYYQRFTGRGHFEYKDMGADFLGVTTSFFLLHFIYWTYKIIQIL